MNTGTCGLDPRTCGHCVVGCDGNGFGESGTYPSCDKVGVLASMLGNDVCGKMLSLEAEKDRKPTVIRDMEAASEAIRAIRTDELDDGAQNIVRSSLNSILDQLGWAMRRTEWALNANKEGK